MKIKLGIYYIINLLLLIYLLFYYYYFIKLSVCFMNLNYIFDIAFVC
jgi:hypothetical protein